MKTPSYRDALFKEAIESLDSEELKLYPHVLFKLEVFWGFYPEIEQVFDDLLLDWKCDENPRKGFSFKAIQDIVSLKEKHQEQFPCAKFETRDISFRFD